PSRTTRVANQSMECHHLNREEVRSGDLIHVDLQECLPRHSLATQRRRVETIFQHDSANRCPPYFVAQGISIGGGASTLTITGLTVSGRLDPRWLAKMLPAK